MNIGSTIVTRSRKIAAMGSLEDATDALDRSNRFQVARAEGDQVDEHLGILHTAIAPEISRANFHAFARPLFRLFDLLGLHDFKTDSVSIKLRSPEVERCLTECRGLLGPSGHSGQELPANPTYKQLVQFLTTMMHTLIDGTLTVKSVKKQVVDGTVQTADKRIKSGTTTRKKRERVMEYELEFKAPKNPKSIPYTALERVGHLAPI